MYWSVWSLPMIHRRTGWKCCGQMRPKSSSLASTQLAVFGGGGLSMTPRTPSPPSNMEVETLCFGSVFLLRGTGQLHRVKRTMDGAIYHQGQGIENGSWMGIPAWNLETLMTWRGVGQNPSWDVCKPGGQLQETSDLCDCQQGFCHQVLSQVLRRGQILI